MMTTDVRSDQQRPVESPGPLRGVFARIGQFVTQKSRLNRTRVHPPGPILFSPQRSLRCRP